jgi:cation:H+ antiporter
VVVGLGLGLLAVSAVLLVAGAELFAENAAAAARGLGMTVIGVAFLLAGAEPEEMITAVIASARHRPGLAAGDAIGANLTMLTLVLGLAALARPLPFGGRVRGYALWSALAGGLAALAVAGGTIQRWEGGLLVAAYLAGVALLWWRERQPPVIGEAAEASEAEGEKNEDEREREGEGKGEGTGKGKGPRPAALGLVLALSGVALMAAGGWVAVGGAERVVRALNLTDSAVGLTLLALATTAELFALAWAAMRRGVSEIAVAGVVGSVAYNATASLGVAALVRPLAVSGILAPAIAAAALPAALLAVTPGGRLNRPAGAVLVIGYGAWVTAVLAH